MIFCRPVSFSLREPCLALEPRLAALNLGIIERGVEGSKIGPLRLPRGGFGGRRDFGARYGNKKFFVTCVDIGCRCRIYRYKDKNKTNQIKQTALKKQIN